MLSITGNGRISKFPEVKSTSNNREYVLFQIASKDGYKVDNEDVVTFIDCISYNPAIITLLRQWGKTGMRVVITGSFAINKNVVGDKTYYNPQIMVNSLEVVDTKQESEANNQQANQPKQQKQNNDDYYAASEKIIDPSSDLPF